MTQVNSSPGQNQPFGNVAVISAVSETGAGDTKAKAVAKVVPYAQSEPGRNTETKRM